MWKYSGLHGYTRLTRNSIQKRFIILVESIMGWDNSVLVAICIMYIGWNLHTVLAEAMTDCPHDCTVTCCKSEAEQRTWLKGLKQTHWLDGKLIWCNLFENHCKYNFHDDHVITKMRKIFYYTAYETMQYFF